MPFYETVFETGRNSVAEYADDDEALGAARAHHLRATKGERSLASADTSPPAERIVKLLKYDRHPNELNPSQAMAADSLEKEVKELIKALADENGIVSVGRLSAEVRAISHPMDPSAGPHDSVFKMPETGELSLGTYNDAKGTWS